MASWMQLLVVQLWQDRELLLTLANLVLVMFGDGLKHGTHEFVNGTFTENKNLVIVFFLSVFHQSPKMSLIKLKYLFKLKILIS